MKMKKLLSLVLTVACAFSLVACGGSSESSEEEAATDEKVTAKVMEFDLTSEQYAFGVDKDQPELLEDVDAFVKKIKEDGTLDEICERYFGDGEPVAVQSATRDDSKDQLVVATNAAFAPFEYTQGESYMGIDMEIAALLAEELGMELVIENMDFDAVCLTVGQHKCDIAMAGLTVNEEREAYVTFSESYYEASQRLVVPSNDGRAVSGSGKFLIAQPALR
ncbi:MAG: transporter substrate-binding domain-containing protein, partial [Dorea sp.]